MALDEADVELIRASWVPARTDPIGAGVLLFKGLFTKFPDYLKLFNQFDDLDLEQIQDNKRLVKHAVKVIETVTFVVDSIGDPTKAQTLNGALVSLVQGHQRRAIGYKEFHNLGIVLIDFICDLNNRRQNSSGQLANRCCNSSTNSSQDSETMTSTLDRVRASLSPSSSSDDDNLLARTLISESNDELVLMEGGRSPEHNHNRADDDKFNEDHNANSTRKTHASDQADSRAAHLIKLDHGQLVTAWKKLYKVILDLVKSEESAAHGED